MAVYPTRHCEICQHVVPVNPWRRRPPHVRCPECDREVARVRNANLRAVKVGAASGLTVVEWRAIVEGFHGRCAYCRKGAYDVLDHAAGIEAGTTPANCRPACFRCNALKMNDPAYVGTFRARWPSVSERVRDRLWAVWRAEGLAWGDTGHLAFAEVLLGRNLQPSTVNSYLGQLSAIGQERGLAPLGAGAIALRRKLTSMVGRSDYPTRATLRAGIPSTRSELSRSRRKRR